MVYHNQKEGKASGFYADIETHLTFALAEKSAEQFRSLGFRATAHHVEVS